jgi:hypothetical protein
MTVRAVHLFPIQQTMSNDLRPPFDDSRLPEGRGQAMNGRFMGVRDKQGIRSGTERCDGVHIHKP